MQTLNLSAAAYQEQVAQVTEKECLCIGLSNAAAIAYDQPFVQKLHAVTICPGPNIVNFSKIVSLQTMVDHIYGRINIMSVSGRPHMFIAELRLYINYLKEQLNDQNIKQYTGYYSNLKDGIAYYRQLPALSGSAQFHQDLWKAERDLDEIPAFSAK